MPFDTPEMIRKPAKPQAPKPVRNFSTKQAAERLGVCQLTIRRLVKAKKLRAFYLSARSMRIPEAEIERIEAEGVSRNEPPCDV